MGHDAKHVVDVGLVGDKDEDIWRYAAGHGAAIITKDEDFVGLHHRKPTEVVVIWVRVGNASRQKLLDWFLPLLPQAIAMIEGGETLIEMR